MQVCAMIEQTVQLEETPMNTAEKAREEFSKRLLEAIELADWKAYGSGKRLADLVEVTPKAASKWLKGDAIPSHDKMVVIASELGVRAEWLEYGIGSITNEVVFSSEDKQEQFGVEVAPEWMTIKVPVMDQNFSAGHGATAEQINDFVSGYERISDTVLAKHGIPSQSARIIKIRGDSMYPTLWDADEVLSNSSDKQLINNKIYAFEFDGRLLVKRFIKRLDGSWLITSDNKDDPSLRDEVVSHHNAHMLRIIAKLETVVYRSL